MLDNIYSKIILESNLSPAFQYWYSEKYNIFHVTIQGIFSIDNILLLIFPFLFYENFIFVLFFSQEISK